MKTLYDISWQVTEPEYRKDPALSYSILSRYERSGFNELAHLFDPISTPSTVFGGMVDAIMTGGKEEFDSQFFVADFPSIGDKEKQIADNLFRVFGSTLSAFNEIPSEYILNAANNLGYYSNYKEATRIDKLIKACSTYYQLLSLSEGKTVVSKINFDKATACVRALRNTYVTSGYFADNEPDSPVQRYYQLKFKHNLEGVDYRCMADLIISDTKNKKVYPFDLKTSGHAEWEFQDSFKTWQYVIQSRLYWRLIRACMDEDDYFKDFSLENYKFIVVNKNTLTPLVWEFPYTKYTGTLIDENGKEYRDPLVIGAELHKYLTERPQVPVGISLNGVNTIKCLKPKENS